MVDYKFDKKAFRESIEKVLQDLQWIKIVGVGDMGVGKTSIIKYYCENQFHSEYHATVGVDYGFKIETVSGNDYRVHIWDFSGDQNYVNVRSELYEHADCVFLCASANEQETFASLKNWEEEITKYWRPPAGTGIKRPCVAVVLNKSELLKRKLPTNVQPEEIKKWAISRNYDYHEVSAQFGNGIKDLFQSLVLSASRHLPNKPITSE